MCKSTKVVTDQLQFLSRADGWGQGWKLALVRVPRHIDFGLDLVGSNLERLRNESTLQDRQS